jgi:hypothetical protein
VIGALLRIYSYLFHLLLALFLVGLALVVILSHSQTEGGSDATLALKLGMLPWKGGALTYWLLGAGLLGLLSILLAWTGRFRFLFLLYALAAFGMMTRGYFVSDYAFSGKDEFRMASWLTAGALLAIFGAWSQFRKKRRK